MRLINFLFVLSICTASAHAQRTAVQADAERDYTAGMTYFDQGLYGQAYDAFDRLLARDLPVNEPEYALLLTRARLFRAKSAVRQDLPQGELMVLDFIQSHQPDPIATDATIELADYYFSSRNYEKAITYYQMVDSRDITLLEHSKVRFREGYSYFVLKAFDSAETAFAQIREIRNEYYYPANYYYGMCRFFAADYQAAIQSFERVSNAQSYQSRVPYYLTQIYFTQGDYDRVIEYGEEKLGGQRVDNKKDMHHLVGQAYFEKGNYARALPHLELYEDGSGKMRAEDFFQLAFVQYDQGLCEKAQSNFLAIANEESALGQRANFYLADCYLKTGDTRSARNAFRSVARMTYDRALQQEAQFNYGKLSAQLDYDFDAIQALDPITSASPYYAEAQGILRDVFENTRDYASALQTLESIRNLSPTLKEAHQRLSLLRGMQLLGDGDTHGADRALTDVQTYPINQSVSAQAFFWRGEIAHAQGNYQQSIDYLNQFFTLGRNVQDLPVQSSVPVAEYNQGYNYLKIKSYNTALRHFQDAIAGIRQNQADYLEPAYTDQLLPDAHLRAGDCLFKRNRYSDAITFYQEAINARKYGHVYGKYQKAMIQGLLNRPLEKIIQLEQLAAQHPTSQFADDALFNAAVTYQELGNSDKALAALSRVVSKYPASDLVNASYLRLGLISYNNGDINAAISNYKKVFNGNPDASEAQEAMAALEEIYVQDLAQPAEYITFVESIPGFSVSQMKRDSVSYRAAEIGYENGDYQKAVTLFTTYLQQFPNGINAVAAHYFRGESHTLLKQYDEAIGDYAEVVKRGNSNYYQKALTKAATMSYNHQQDFRAAHGFYDKLVAVTTDPAELHAARLGLMRSAYRIGARNDADMAASAVVDYGGATQAEQAEARYYLGKNAYDVKNYDNALGHFNLVVSNSDNVQTAEARYLIAQIYYLRRQLDLAEQLCHNATRASSQYPFWVAKSLLLLSDIYVDRNDLFNARAPLEALIENFTGDSIIVEEARKKLQAIEALQAQQSRLKSGASDTLELDTTRNGNN